MAAYKQIKTNASSFRITCTLPAIHAQERRTIGT